MTISGLDHAARPLLDKALQDWKFAIANGELSRAELEQWFQTVFEIGRTLEQNSPPIEAIRFWNEGLELAEVSEANDWLVRISMAQANLWGQIGNTFEVQRALQRATRAIFHDDFISYEEDTYHEILLSHANVLISKGEKIGARQILLSLIRLGKSVRIGAYLTLIQTELNDGELVGARNCLDELMGLNEIPESSCEQLQVLELKCEIEFLEGNTEQCQLTAQQAITLLESLGQRAFESPDRQMRRRRLLVMLQRSDSNGQLN